MMPALHKGQKKSISARTAQELTLAAYKHFT
jgi:hypothetical protein